MKNNFIFRNINTITEQIWINKIEINNSYFKREVGFNNELSYIDLKNVRSIFFWKGLLVYKNHINLRANAGKSTDIRSRLSNYIMAYEKSVKEFTLNMLYEQKKC